MANSILYCLSPYSLSLLVLLGSVLFYTWTSNSVDDLPDLSSQFYKVNMNKKLSAFVCGYTGGVGSAIVRALAREPRFEKVLLVGRRKIELPESDQVSNYKKFEYKILPDFDKILDPESSGIFQGLDVGFYTLGVSSGSVNEATYRKIEYEYSTSVAKYAAAGGCSHFHWLSGNGASKTSWFLFGKVKAQIEEELGEIGFPRVSIYRPAGILTKDNSGGMAGPVAVGILRFLDRWNKLSVEAEDLGNVIVANTFRQSEKSSEMFNNAEIVKMGKDLKNGVSN